MSQSDSPIRAMFDVQRSAIKGGQQLFKQSLAAQQQANQVVLTGLKGQQSLQRQGLELTQAATHSYVDATVAMMPSDGGTDAHQTVDETFAQLKETHAQFYDALERELDRDVDSASELSEEFVEALDEQTEQLLESSRTIEDQTVENVDELSNQLNEQIEQSQQLQDQLEEQLETQTGDVEQLLERQSEQVEQFQQQLEAQAEEVTEQLRAQTKIDTDAEHRLESIEGIDADVRTQLSEAGISTIDDLVRSDADTVAEAAEVSTSDAEEWIEQAEA